MIRLAVLVAVGLCAWSSPGHAHPFAVSQFDAAVHDDTLQVAFNLDGISVGDLVDRYPVHRNRRTALLAYLDDRFAVGNAGTSCARAEQAVVRDGADRVHVQVRYDCLASLSIVEISSTLFLDEDTPHRVIGTVRYGRRLERYLFGRSERAATLDVSRDTSRLGSGPPTLNSQQFRTASPPPGAFSRVAAPPPPAQDLGTGFLAFVRLGVHHIFAGLDHILFVVVLVLAVRSVRELVAVITAFTVAHSVTLLLGGLGLVTVSASLVEPLIAASIVYVALENLVRPPRHRMAVVFGFGLMHGFGFAGALGSLDLSAADRVPMLLGLNIGVELGQLAIVLPLFGLLGFLRRRERAYALTRFGISGAAALVGLVWFATRVC